MVADAIVLLADVSDYIVARARYIEREHARRTELSR